MTKFFGGKSKNSGFCSLSNASVSLLLFVIVVAIDKAAVCLDLLPPALLFLSDLISFCCCNDCRRSFNTACCAALPGRLLLE
jgi:hypothetical protein